MTLIGEIQILCNFPNSLNHMKRNGFSYFKRNQNPMTDPCMASLTKSPSIHDLCFNRTRPRYSTFQFGGIDAKEGDLLGLLRGTVSSMSIPGFPQEIRPLLRGLVGKMMVHKLGLSLKKWGCKVFHSHEESSSMTFPNCRFFFGASTLQFWCGFWWRIWCESLLKMCVNVKICSLNCETMKFL